MMDKKTLRKEMAAKRAEVYGVVDTRPALVHLRRALKGAVGPISFYWPMRSEIDPRPVMEEVARRETVCLPVTVAFSPLTFRRWSPGDEMELDGFGVGIPVREEVCEPRTLVVPLLAFDASGHRLGYGAGHYDRTLEKLRKLHAVTAIGFAYSAQKCRKLPTERTDQPLDMIVTEQCTLIPG